MNRSSMPQAERLVGGPTWGPQGAILPSAARTPMEVPTPNPGCRLVKSPLSPQAPMPLLPSTVPEVRLGGSTGGASSSAAQGPAEKRCLSPLSEMTRQGGGPSMAGGVAVAVPLQSTRTDLQNLVVVPSGLRTQVPGRVGGRDLDRAIVRCAGGHRRGAPLQSPNRQDP